MTIFLLFVLFMLLMNPQIVSKEVVNAASLWFTVLLPTMYPSFVVIDMISVMPLSRKISKLMFPIFKIIFNIKNEKSCFIILLALLCGAPASTKLIYNSIMNNEISEYEGQNLACAFSFLSMPYTLMIMKIINVNALVFYVFLLGLSIVYMKLFNRKKQKILKFEETKVSYSKTFFNSIKKNIDITINILGILVIFRVILKLLFKDNFIFYPYLEILGGIASANNKFIILSSLGFLGFSVHLQMLNIFENMNYRKFFISRLYYLMLGILAFF